MFGTVKGRVVVILLVIIAAGWSLYDNYASCVKTSSTPESCSVVRLGLDLQGGMHLALEVADPDGTMTPEARADATDRALQVIRTRIDEFGVEEPLIQKVGDTRIIVELAGITDEQRAKEIIQQTAFLEFQLVTDGQAIVNALPRIDRAIVQALGPEGLPAETGTERQGESVEDLLFGGRDTARAQEETAEADSIAQARPLTALLLDGGPGQFLVAAEDVRTVERYLELPEVQRVTPRGVELRWAAELESVGAQLYRRLYALEDRPIMTGAELENAVAGRSPQNYQPQVNFELTRSGGRIFSEVTGRHIGDQLAIVLDNRVFSAPVINARIGRSGVIEMGQGTLQEANDLALVLRAGALPAPLEIVEERTVGPSLGADSINQGMIAGVLGVVAVILIMIVYYRVAGFLAVLALGVYVLLVLGGLAAFNATLTAPGIAGLILTIGMAVDANVLIFERIREELAVGKAVRTAVDEGFNNALSAIVDSNLTTLLTALILFQFGTGPVRGFAVTLSIGIIASFFSAVYVTRSLFLIYLQRKRATETISI